MSAAIGGSGSNPYNSSLIINSGESERKHGAHLATGEAEKKISSSGAAATLLGEKSISSNTINSFGTTVIASATLVRLPAALRNLGVASSNSNVASSNEASPDNVASLESVAPILTKETQMVHDVKCIGYRTPKQGRSTQNDTITQRISNFASVVSGAFQSYQKLTIFARISSIVVGLFNLEKANMMQRAAGRSTPSYGVDAAYSTRRPDAKKEIQAAHDVRNVQVAKAYIRAHNDLEEAAKILEATKEPVEQAQEELSSVEGKIAAYQAHIAKVQRAAELEKQIPELDNELEQVELKIQAPSTQVDDCDDVAYLDLKAKYDAAEAELSQLFRDRGNKKLMINTEIASVKTQLSDLNREIRAGKKRPPNQPSQQTLQTQMANAKIALGQVDTDFAIQNERLELQMGSCLSDLNEKAEDINKARSLAKKDQLTQQRVLLVNEFARISQDLDRREESVKQSVRRIKMAERYEAAPLRQTIARPAEAQKACDLAALKLQSAEEECRTQKNKRDNDKRFDTALSKEIKVDQEEKARVSKNEIQNMFKLGKEFQKQVAEQAARQAARQAAERAEQAAAEKVRSREHQASVARIKKYAPVQPASSRIIMMDENGLNGQPMIPIAPKATWSISNLFRSLFGLRTAAPSAAAPAEIAAAAAAIAAAAAKAAAAAAKAAEDASVDALGDLVHFDVDSIGSATATIAVVKAAPAAAPAVQQT